MASKKGQVFSAGLVIVTLLVLVALGVTLLTKQSKIEGDGIGGFGEYSTKVFDAYKHQQELLFELDTLATYAALDSLHNLSETAGLNITKCGDYAGYVILDPQSEDCSPSKEIRGPNYLNLFKQKLPGYLSLNQHLNLVSTSYIYSFEEDNGLVIAGDLSDKVFFEIEYLIYTVNPPFTTQLDYDMKDYSRIIAKSKKLISECGSSSELKTCAENEIKDFNLQWSLDDHISDDRYLRFNVTSSKKYLYYDKLEGTTDLRPIIIKFALEISQPGLKHEEGRPANALKIKPRGEISFELYWAYDTKVINHEGPDIDLHVIDPNNEHVFFVYTPPKTLEFLFLTQLARSRNEPLKGGMDYDDKGACEEGDGAGPERIWWDSATKGTYTYYVAWFDWEKEKEKVCATDITHADYTLNIYIKSTGTNEFKLVDTKTGTLNNPGEESLHYTYEFTQGASPPTI